LEVSFFGPFYGAYNIIALDKKTYRYAMIAGPNRDYLWILARTPTLDKATLQDLVAQAAELGFATEQLIYDQHR
jgi:apolipoprotein D and lipocalin family protein